MRNLKRTFTPTRLRSGLCFLVLLIAPGVVAVTAITLAVAGNNRVEGTCNPVTLLTETFDGVTPPALPPGWSSITRVTSNSGVPTPPADTLPNAAFVDDPATISDKQLLSPTIGLGLLEPSHLSFRNNFNLQEGFDGGVLEISFDHGLTFQDVVAAGGTFASGGYNGTISSCCGNPLAGRQAWTGNSGGFINTTVNLPFPPPPETTMILRWRMGSDSSLSGEGWRIDTIAISECQKPIPTPPRATPRPCPKPATRPTPP